MMNRNNADHLDVQTETDSVVTISNETGLMQEQRERLQKRVLEMLRDPDPVRGIYAMYGAHERPPLCCQKK